MDKLDRVAERITVDWLPFHKGESFTVADIYHYFDWREQDVRAAVSKVMYELSTRRKTPLLEKTGRHYRVIDRSVNVVNWWDEDEDDLFHLKFPEGKEGTMFGFADIIRLYPGEVVVIAGVSNWGKTLLALNLAIENAANYTTRYMSSESTKGGKLKHRLSHFPKEKIFNGNGIPLFEVVERRSNHKDILLPDGLNIIDWINLTDNFYLIGKILEDIQATLRKGLAVVVLQKSESKAMGRGGDFSRDLASLYLTIDPGTIKVEKCKSYNGDNPNGKRYAFDIVDKGSHFQDIHEVVDCPQCKGARYYRGYKCSKCKGTGFVEKEVEYDEAP